MRAARLLQSETGCTAGVDIAVESGGNVEGSQLDKEVDINGVRVIGLGNLPGHVAVHASQMYSSNLTNLIESFWSAEQKTFVLDAANEIIKGCLITHQGQIVNEQIRTSNPTLPRGE